MRYITTITITIILTLSSNAFASELVQPDLLLSEIQLGSDSSASDEYIEIANTRAFPVSLNELRIEYKSASGANWSLKSALNGHIAPLGKVLVSTYLEDGYTMKSGLSGSGGHVRLVNEGIEVDRVGWGSADASEGLAVNAPNFAQVLKRVVDEDGKLSDTNQNNQDWKISDSPTPEHVPWEEDIAECKEPDTESQPTIVAPPSNTPELPSGTVADPPLLATHSLFITEIMPDPTSPLTDADHEFIEIHNPNNFAVDLQDYRLEAGTDWRYGYTLGSFFLEPNGYIAIFSQDSNLTLANKGGQVRLLGPNDATLDEQDYPKATPGLSWSRLGSGWVWAEPTAHNANRQAAQTLGVTNASTQDVPILEKRDVEFPVASGNEASASTSFDDDSISEETHANNWVLAGFGTLGLGYALYEYRQDIRIRFEQLRRFIALRRENREQT